MCKGFLPIIGFKLPAILSETHITAGGFGFLIYLQLLCILLFLSLENDKGSFQL